MFMYFPTNYVWSLSVVATLNNGGLIDEVDRACRPVLEASQNGDDAGTEELYAAWKAVASSSSSGCVGGGHVTPSRRRMWTCRASGGPRLGGWWWMWWTRWRIMPR